MWSSVSNIVICEIKLLKLKANYNQPVFNYELYNIVICEIKLLKLKANYNPNLNVFFPDVL